LGIGDWVLGIGDWVLGDSVIEPVEITESPNTQYPYPINSIFNDQTALLEQFFDLADAEDRT